VNGDPATMRAWLDAHSLADAELLHLLPNHGPDGADLLTDPEVRLLSELLEVRRTVVPGYRPMPGGRPTVVEQRPCSPKPVGLFDPDPGRQSAPAGVERLTAAPNHPPDRQAPITCSRPPASQASGSRSRSDSDEPGLSRLV
jgi:hypothetical protein